MPSYLEGSLLFQLPYKGLSVGTEIDILVYKPSIIYIAYEDSTSGSYGRSLEYDGWSLVTNQGGTNTECCTLTYVWRKYVTLDSLTTISIPKILKTEFVFSLFAQTQNFLLPDLSENPEISYQILTAFDEVLVWSDSSFKFSNLPNYLRGSMFFQFGYTSNNQGEVLRFSFHRTSIVYLAYEDINDSNFEAYLAENGWTILTSQGEINTGCCTFNKIWKLLTSSNSRIGSLHDYTLDFEVPFDQFVFAIFVQDQEGFVPQV